MVDSSSIGSTFRSWSGAGESLNSNEFKGALNQADSNKDGKLSRTEFDKVASQLGLSSSEADNFFDKAKGSGSEVTISSLVSAANDFNATDGKWTKDEFSSLVSDYKTATASSVFDGLAGTDGVLDRDELKSVISDASSDCDPCISSEEFSKIAEALGVEDPDSEAVKSAFKDITGDKSSATADEVLSYFSAFADKDGSYTESAFDSLVKNLSGAGDDDGDCGCGSTSSSSSSSTTSGDTENSTSASDTSGSSSSSTSTTSDSTATASSSKEDFEYLAGTDNLIQRDEFEAVFDKVDAGQDDKLSIEEFRSAAIRMGVDPSKDDNIDAVFNVIANGGSSITTGQALAYLGGLNGDDNDWSQTEFDAVLSRLSNGPDGTEEAGCADTTTESTADTATDTTAGSTTDAATAAETEACETTEPSAEFTEISGTDNLIQRPEFRADLKEADLDGDKKLSKAEFLNFAYELGAPTSSKDNILEIYDIISDGGKGDIGFGKALKYLDQFKGDDKTWNESEFDDIVTRLTEGAPSVFSSLATDGVITTATIKEEFKTAAGDDNKLSAKEFETLAAKLGVTDLNDSKFSVVAGKDDLINLAELTGYANPFGSTENSTVSWDETQFDSLVADLSAKSS